MSRYSISVSPELQSELDKVKQEKYYKDSNNKMLNDLVRLGLEAYQSMKDSDEQNSEEKFT